VKFLLDTNAISEPARPRPDSGVLAWLAAADEDSVFLSAITIAELRHGIQRLTDGKKRTLLDAWLQRDLRVRFRGRILAIDYEVADACGRILALSESKGRRMEVRDAYIAACAEVHGLTLVTRNVKDFEAVFDRIVMPWSGSGGKRP
jgi:toxin FitB